MTLKRILMPVFVLGIFLTLSSMAFGQASPVNCVLTAPQGASGHAGNTELTAPVGAGPVEIPNAMTNPPLPGIAGPSVTPNTPEAGGGTVRVTCTNTGGAFNPGVVALTIAFGNSITNSQTHPTGATGIRVTRGTGDFIAAGATTASVAGANVGINAVNNTAGTVVIGLGLNSGGGSTCTALGCNSALVTGVPFTAGPGFTSTFDLEGVLISTSGKSGAVTATLVSTGGLNITGGSAQVIDSVQASLADPTVPIGTLPTVVTGAPIPPGFVSTGIAGGPAVLNSSGGAVKNNFTLRIQEAYASVFKESAQYNGGGIFPASTSSDTQVLIVFSNIPAGFDISGCSAFLTDVNGNATGGAPSASQTNITSASPIVTINFNAPVDPTAIDVLWLVCTKVTVGTSSLPLPAQAVTAQVTMGPTGTALSGLGAAQTGLTTGQVPRYTQALVPTTPLTVVVFPPANTSLIVSFAFVGSGYNTGLAIANTTVDPFTPAGGGAAASSGTVQFLLVKNDGTTRTYTTSASSPGNGLTGAGVVASGSTYVVNLSELLTAANFGTTFTGYIFITANFTHAHGSATIYTTANGNAALNAPVLVLPATVSSAAPRGNPESLGQ